MSLSTREREAHERVIDFVHGADFRAFYSAILAPMVEGWRQDLCTNTALSEAEMRARQYAITELQAGIERAFEAAGVEIPDWLRQELSL